VKNKKVILIFLLPALVFYILFILYPVFRTFYNSFFKIGAFRIKYVGLKNFREIVKDEIFWKSAKNTLIWAGASIVLEIGTAFLLALALFNKIWLHRFFRVAWFVPVLIPYIVTGIIWLWIYNYDWGVLNTILRTIGLRNFVVPWLGNPKTALPALIVGTTWMWTGFNMVILLAAMHSIPHTIFDAAKVDGANSFQIVTKVMIPLLRPTFSNLVVLCFIGKMRVFDMVWVTTEGGPLWSTETVATYIFKRAFKWNVYDLGYPSALATLWFIVIFVISLILGRLIKGSEIYEY